MKIVLLEHVMLLSHLSAYRAQCLKPSNSEVSTIKHFFLRVFFYIFLQCQTIVNLY